jgi:hypothetical protein
MLPRRQRWAAFSVRAHKDLASLASDVLLYDRLVLPVPADEAERRRWFRNDWDPDVIALRYVQAAGLIYTVPWTEELRAEYNEAVGLERLSGEVLYGWTASLLSTSQTAWAEILAGLEEDAPPDRRPFLVAAYQSPEEAAVGLALRELGDDQRAPTEQPGERSGDQAVALSIRVSLDEFALSNPEEAFLTAVELANKRDFQVARRQLFGYVDGLETDQVEPSEVAREISSLEEAYNQAVHDHRKPMRRRAAVTLLPRLVGSGASLASGLPGGGAAGGVLGRVLGRFICVPPSPDEHPGRAFSMIRAAYRE